MVPHDISLPDAKLHIAKLAKAFPELTHDARLELRMLKFDGVKPQSKSRSFDPTNLLSVDQVLKFAKQYNENGWNICGLESRGLQSPTPHSAMSSDSL